MEKADRYCFDALVAQLGSERCELLLAERLSHAAVSVAALVDFEAEVAWNEWPWHVKEDVVELVTVLAPDLDRISKAPRGDQRSPRAFPFDNCIRDQGGSVNEVVDLIGRNATPPKCVCQDRLNGERRISRRRQRFPDAQLASLVIHQNEICKGAADVHADPKSASIYSSHYSL